MAIRRSALWVLLAAALFGCSRKLDRKAYVAWVRDYQNGLHVNKTEGDFIWDVPYTPAEYVGLQRGASPEKPPDEAGKNGLNALQYFTVTVSLREAGMDFMNYQQRDAEEKQRRLYYFSYQFQHDVVLEEEGQRLPCVLYHFERYSTSALNSRTFVLGFENPHPSATEATLVIDSPAFGAVPLKIKVSKKHIPALQL